MYEYNLSVAMGIKETIIDERLIEAIKAAIISSNTSYSAMRLKRNIQYVGQTDAYHFNIRMTSRDSINPTRSLSSLSRALIAYVNQNCPGLLDGKITKDSVFRAAVIEEDNSPASGDISNSDLVKYVVDILTDEKYASVKDETLKSLKDIIAKAIESISDNKSENSIQD